MDASEFGERYQLWLWQLGRQIERHLNGEGCYRNRRVGFLLLAFPVDGGADEMPTIELREIAGGNGKMIGNFVTDEKAARLVERLVKHLGAIDGAAASDLFGVPPAIGDLFAPG